MFEITTETEVKDVGQTKVDIITHLTSNHFV